MGGISAARTVIVKSLLRRNNCVTPPLVYYLHSVPEVENRHTMFSSSDDLCSDVIINGFIYHKILYMLFM